MAKKKSSSQAVPKKNRLRQAPEKWRERHDSSILKCPFGDPVFWFAPERFQLPIWPEFMLSIRWVDSNAVIHPRPYLHVLEFPLYGDLILEARDRKILITPGNAGIIHQGEYTVLRTGPSGFCNKLSIGLRGNPLSVLMSSCALSERQTVALTSPERIVPLFRKIANLLGQKKQADIPQISALTMELFNIVVLSTSREPDEHLSTAMNLLSANLAKRIKISEIVKELAISRTALERLFMKHTGRTPYRWLYELKLNHAADLLRTTKLSAQEIAFRIGYEDSLAFSREFRKFTGSSPRKYRELCNSSDSPEMIRNFS